MRENKMIEVKYHRVAITIEKELWNEVQEEAKKIGMSASALMRMVFISYKEKQKRKTK